MLGKDIEYKTEFFGIKNCDTELIKLLEYKIKELSQKIELQKSERWGRKCETIYKTALLQVKL